MQPGAGPSGSSSSLAHSRDGPAPSTSDSAAQQHQHQLEASASLEDTLTAQDFADVMCGGCGLTINEDSADAGVVHFATSLWHLECFRCAKCHEKVSTDRDDILLLSDGHPICGQCNYSCQICGLPILEEAIMTGEESYHASCFTCRSCNSRIEELVFAKTSQGIYCMPCHNERVARSRRHADNKRRTRNKDGTSSSSRRKKDSVGGAPGAAPTASASSPRPSTNGNEARSPQPHSSPAVLAPPTPSPRKASVGLPDSTPTLASMDGSAPPTPLADSGRSNIVEAASPAPPPPNPKDSVSPSMPSSSSIQHTPSPSIGRPGGQPTLRELRSGTMPRPTTADSNFSRASPLPRPPTSESNHLNASVDSLGRERANSKASLDGRRSPSRDATPSIEATTPVGLGIEATDALSTPTKTSTPATTTPRRPSADATLSAPSTSARGGTASSDVESESGDHGLTQAQVRRASKLSVKDLAAVSHAKPASPSQGPDLLKAPPQASVPSGPSGQSSLEAPPLAGSFSFYDPDLMNLMDTFGQFDGSEGIQLSSPMLDQFNATVNAEGPSSPSPASRTVPLDAPAAPSPSSRPSGSPSMNTLRARVRESLKAADDGRVSMDTSFIESILQELEDTKAQMKSLQLKYQRMKRASHQAAQGFSHAKTEFEQQVHAREEAELQMLKLKQQLSEQASKLTSVAKQEQRNERMARRSKDVKSSLEDMTRDLAKLTVERDMTVAEVAELIAMQDGRAPLPPSKSPPLTQGPAGDDSSSSSTSNKALQSRLSVRLDGVKAKYRKEISDLTNQRDELLLEIEDLRQSRDVYLEETEALNTRNEELNLLLSKLQSRVESLTAAEYAAQAARDSMTSTASKSSPARPPSNLAAPGGGGAAPSASKGSWFGGRSKQSSSSSSSNHQHNTSSISSARDLPGYLDRTPSAAGGTTTTASSSLGIDTDATSMSSGARGGLALPPHQAVMARAEAAAAAAAAMTTTSSAAAKKFKWMKAGAKSAGQGIASALPGVHSPPVPPKTAGSLGGVGSTAGVNGGMGASSSGITNGAGSGGGSALPLGNEVVVREHLFQPFNVLRPTRCFACQKNMWGQSEVRCALCGQVCHSKCLQSLSISCNQPYLGAAGGGAGGAGLGILDAGVNGGGDGSVAPTVFGRSLVEQVASEGRTPDSSSSSSPQPLLVPLLVEKCIAAVEANGMDFEGIYRKSGGSSQLKIITQLFERGQRFDLEDCDRFNDVSAVTSVLKNYFRELPEPLLTYELHEAFIEAAEMPAGTGAAAAAGQGGGDGEGGMSGSTSEHGVLDGTNESTTTDPTPFEAKKDRILQLLQQLPPAHHDTLKVLCLHLKRIGDRQAENRMTPRNLGVVFGPTLMRSRDPSREFADMGQKSITVEWLCEHAEVVFGEA